MSQEALSLWAVKEGAGISKGSEAEADTLDPDAEVPENRK